MERTYWRAWENYLHKSGLKPFVRELLNNSRSLMTLLSQVMILGIPFFRCLPQGSGYVALVETLGDRERLKKFVDFLMEVEE